MVVVLDGAVDERGGEPGFVIGGGVLWYVGPVEVGLCPGLATERTA